MDLKNLFLNVTIQGYIKKTDKLYQNLILSTLRTK